MKLGEFETTEDGQLVTGHSITGRFPDYYAFVRTLHAAHERGEVLLRAQPDPVIERVRMMQALEPLTTALNKALESLDYAAPRFAQMVAEAVVEALAEREGRA
jgi:hypothetical protein